MKNEKMHLIPQVIIDCVDNLSSTRQDDLKLNYIMRLEAIRDYCDAAVKASSQRNTFSNNRSKGRYSRIGFNNA